MSNPFPFLSNSNCIVTSPATPSYNCIAWAARDTRRWWWPVPGVYFWPSSAPYEETIEAFVAAFATLGFQQCETAALENGWEKVVIYVNASRVPTHMARQLPDGAWTSKLGSYFDIQHSQPEDVEGPAYGSPVVYLRRLVEVAA
jgi:hypothetical protein